MNPLVTEVKRRFAQHADPVRAESQRSYAKSEMPFHGITTEPMRAILREIFKEQPCKDAAHWCASIEALWDNADRREERFAAIELFSQPKHLKSWVQVSHLDLVRKLVTEGAWWDFVDALATKPVAHLVRFQNAEALDALSLWIKDPNTWVRRVAILAQLKRKAETNKTFLAASIEGSMDDSDFFARKAIGWALREFSKTEPDWVIDFVEKNSDQLSPLSRREAIKVMCRSGYEPALRLR